ncbi:MAG TPA: hypothetical protein VK427_24085, partial [Kofleriaceae bacterium]|nr:hypothetical protein [Kofleriaceae bacterium]
MRTAAVLCLAACASASSPAPARPSAHADVVANLIGNWVGTADSPMGAFPFAIAFSREGGDVHGRFGNSEQYLDFRFHQQDGQWLLTEEGKLPGVGVQKHTLKPAGPAARWIDDSGRLLEVTLELREPKLVFSTKLRGEP